MIRCAVLCHSGCYRAIDRLFTNVSWPRRALTIALLLRRPPLVVTAVGIGEDAVGVDFYGDGEP